MLDVIIVARPRIADKLDSLCLDLELLMHDGGGCNRHAEKVQKQKSYYEWVFDCICAQGKIIHFTNAISLCNILTMS